MKNKNKQLQKQQQTTRQLIGIENITDYSLQTGFGDLAFFSIKPSNISVLSNENLTARIYALTTVFKGLSEMEILCINSKENFDGNKNFLKERLQNETNPAVQKLLTQDIEYLDHIQAQTATAREFLMIVRLRGMKEKEIFPYLNRIQKMLKEQGFSSKQLEKEEIKTLLAVYFEQNVTSERVEDFEGENCI